MLKQLWHSATVHRRRGKAVKVRDRSKNYRSWCVIISASVRDRWKREQGLWDINEILILMMSKEPSKAPLPNEGLTREPLPTGNSLWQPWIYNRPLEWIFWLLVNRRVYSPKIIVKIYFYTFNYLLEINVIYTVTEWWEIYLIRINCFLYCTDSHTKVILRRIFLYYVNPLNDAISSCAFIKKYPHWASLKKCYGNWPNIYDINIYWILNSDFFSFYSQG